MCIRDNNYRIKLNYGEEMKRYIVVRLFYDVIWLKINIETIVT